MSILRVTECSSLWKIEANINLVIRLEEDLRLPSITYLKQGRKAISNRVVERTPTFEWNITRLVFEIGQCLVLHEIELCARNIDITLRSIVNTIGMAYVTTSRKELTLDS
jgi:hypothetical protein